ncbi:hypothetical protein DXG03_001121 [Asterophora parasitica]|uniref:Knr4/Smi1-like domain-containing protein n=1 Tax=Asterophora parasitica TaxID=117018 RepID=A0A9P7GC57_9AGAR|nr:hypothetical protein DXG03_001121 [Asterophora parasitica]
MGWLSSLFSSSDTSQYSARNGQALSSTHEAFSLPTSSPTFTPHSADAFNPEALQTPDLDSSMSPSYTYPPQGPGAYGYVSASAGLHSRPASLLPTHHNPSHTHSPKFTYPPLSSTWNRLRVWLSREYPELGDTLNYGILPQDLAQIEMQFGFALPSAIRESYLCVDGQEAESAAGCSEGLFFGLKLLPLEDVLQEWRFWREVDDDPATGANHRLRQVMQSIPPGWIRKEYSQRGWIPLIADKVGNYVGVDLNPDESGSVGQVIVFGRDFDTKVVLWRGDGPGGWAKWLASFVEELESGEGIELGNGNEGSDDSEDDLGYESYFYDGTGRGQGDGGGDVGNGGGLRLTGEYRGWNVLEALADRSLRRWHEAGVITDTSLLSTEEENKNPEPVVLDLTHESSAEVGIPVLAAIDDAIPAPSITPALGQVNTASRAGPSNLPTISVTRPPAPLPVELPQPHDILPPGSSQSSFDEDLESGHSAGMREVANIASSSRQSKQQPALPSEIVGARGSKSTASSPPTRSRPTTPTTATTSALSIRKKTVDIPDLLADSAPALDTKPIFPSSSASVPAEIPTIHAAAKTAPSDEPSKPVEVEEFDPNTIPIRLVGGGGVSGTVQPEEEEEEQFQVVESVTERDADTASIASVSSTKGGKTHKKTKSGLAGLKKLGNLGRKRDSGSSVKDSPVAT